MADQEINTFEDDFMSRVTCRHIKQNEVKETFNLINQEGWNLTLGKFSTLCEKSINSFYVAVTPDGEIIGTLSYFQTFDEEYVCGNVVVKEAWRGKGLGRKLIRDTLAMFSHRVVHLTAVPGADGFYMKLGFQLSSPQQSHVIIHMTLDRPRLDSKVAGFKHSTSDVKIDLLHDSKYKEEDLIDFDLRLRGYNNATYLSTVAHCSNVLVANRSPTMVNDDNSKTDTADKPKDNIIAGYAIAFLNKGKIVVDGVFAYSDEVALLLFREVLQLFPSESIMKLQMFPSNQLLAEFGQINSQHGYNRYSYGGNPTTVPEESAYSVSDSDYVL